MRAIRKLQVKKLRKQKGMSQSQLAKALGVAKGSVSLTCNFRIALMMFLLCPPHSGAWTLLFLLSAFLQQHMTDGGICRGV